MHQPRLRVLLATQIGLLVIAIGCDSRNKTVVAAVEKPVGNVIEVKPPLGLPPVPIPPDNPPTLETVALGRKLFYDKRLSADDSVACASCHSPVLGFTDGKKHSTGFGGKSGSRNAPTLLNAAYDRLQFWDGRAPSLEEQAGVPMQAPFEMNLNHDLCISKLEANASYKADFQTAFGPGPITIGKVKSALATFERTLLSGNSAFDRYEFGGDRSAMHPAAVRGLAVFQDKQKGNCATCHSIGDAYALFTDNKFHNIGVSVNAEGELTDLGRFNETKVETDKGAFKTPTLRNVAKTGPYMHDGSMKTLKEVVDFYAGGGNSNPYLDKEIKEVHLSGQERADLVQFLEALTGDPPANAGPVETGRAGGSK